MHPFNFLPVKTDSVYVNDNNEEVMILKGIMEDSNHYVLIINIETNNQYKISTHDFREKFTLKQFGKNGDTIYI